MKTFAEYLKAVGEYGELVEINKPLVSVAGLPHVKAREIIVFEGGAHGEVFSISEDRVEVVLFTRTEPLIGERATRTNEFLTVPVGKELLGRVIDPLGNFLLKPGPKKFTESRILHARPDGIMKRATIKAPLSTGMSVVDMMLPLGKGQKELIIGDRKTGKTSFLLTTVKSQVNHGLIVVFAAIARKRSSIKRIIDFFEREKITDKIVTVATTSFDSPGLIYLTPFTALSVAEYFRDNGQDVLVILDDLSAHAKFYREMSLVAGRFPGRESYPGDIFFTHARLLERTGNFVYTGPATPEKKTEVSITCLPVVETIESDLTSYIATNIMSMTDGHIFFDQGTFAKGRRPAINIPLSVTRVGRQAQSGLKRDINHKLTAFLNLYDKMQNLAHFGAELSGKVQTTLSTGDKLFEFFNQRNFVVIPEAVQLVTFGLIWANVLPAESIEKVREKLSEKYADPAVKKVLSEIIVAESLDELILHVSQKKDELFKLAELDGPTAPIQQTQQPTTPQTQQVTTQQQPEPAGQSPLGGAQPTVTESAQDAQQQPTTQAAPEQKPQEPKPTDINTEKPKP